MHVALKSQLSVSDVHSLMSEIMIEDVDDKNVVFMW